MRKLLGWAEALLVFSISALAFLGVLLLLRALGEPLWSGEAAGWTQAIGSIVAIFAAFLVADRQFQMSRRETRATMNEGTITRIKILSGVFQSVILESARARGSLRFSNGALDLDTVRVIELRETIRAIPVMDAPTSDFAISIAAIPAAIDVMLRSIDEYNECVENGAPTEVRAHFGETLAHRAHSVHHMCQLAIDRGDEKIQQLLGFRDL